MIGTRREFPPPAYKTGTLSSSATVDGRDLHIIDFLMGHAKHVVDDALRDLHTFLQSSGASTTDEAIVCHWDRFEESVGGCSADLTANATPRRQRAAWFSALRDGLKADVEACLAEWSGLMGGPGSAGVEDYREKVELTYETWRAIKPRLPSTTGGLGGKHDEDAAGLSLLTDWLLGTTHGLVAPELGPWELLKASFAFRQHHRRRFVWQMAGRQLQHIKALSVVAGAPSVLVASNMYAALRTDNAYVKRLMARISDGDSSAFAGRDDGGPRDGELGVLPWSSSPADEE